MKFMQLITGHTRMPGLATVVFLLAAMLLVGCNSSSDDSAPLETGLQSMMSDNRERNYYIDLPSDYASAGSSKALLFAFHGSCGSYENWLEALNPNNPGLATLGDAVGDDAIIVYPQAFPNAANCNQWDATFDYLFFEDLLAELELRGLLWNSNKVFATGHSSGAALTHELGCFYGDVLRGIAPQAGSLTSNSCIGSVAVIQSQGEFDQQVPAGIGDFAHQFWKAYNGFGDSTPTQGVVAECADDSAQPLGNVDYPVQWCLHSEGSPNDLFTGHAWPSFASQAFWSFFKALPEVTPTVDFPPGGGNDVAKGDADGTMTFTLTFPSDIKTVTSGTITLYAAGTEFPAEGSPTIFLNVNTWNPGQVTPGSSVTYNRIPIKWFSFGGDVTFPKEWVIQWSVYVEGGNRPIPIPGIDQQARLEWTFSSQNEDVMIPGEQVVAPFEELP